MADKIAGYKLYLDDVRKTPIGWLRAYTAAECIAMLEKGDIVELSLDHDLSDDHYVGKFDAGTGYAVVLWLENKVREDPTFKMPTVHLHTMNPVGREHMRKGLERIDQFIEIRKAREAEPRIRAILIGSKNDK